MVSGVDEVDGLLSTDSHGTVDPGVPDLFRLAPGQGPQFHTVPRLLTTGGSDSLQVFHDGEYDPGLFAEVIPQLRVGDIPLSSGSQIGDGQQASHLKDDGRSGIQLGILDATLRQGRHEEATEVDLRTLGVIGWDVRDTGTFDDPARERVFSTEPQKPVGWVFGRVMGVPGADRPLIPVSGSFGGRPNLPLSGNTR